VNPENFFSGLSAVDPESLRIPGSGRSLGKGTYIVILYLSGSKRIRIGRLGEFQFRRGYYTYVGSAFGPGGLAARLRHHANIAGRPHWHVDYLRQEALVAGMLFQESSQRHEHEWAKQLLGMHGASPAIAGFGSSDCNCRTHLIYFTKKALLFNVRIPLDSKKNI